MIHRVEAAGVTLLDGFRLDATQSIFGRGEKHMLAEPFMAQQFAASTALRFFAGHGDALSRQVCEGGKQVVDVMRDKLLTAHGLRT